jgi:outer membrane receptor protein involved in Fe transport
VSGVAACSLIASAAWAEGKVHVSIPAGSMEAALGQLAKQTGVNILFESRLIDGLKSPAIDSTLTPEDAVRRLVGRTELQVAPDGAGGIVLRRPAKPMKVSVLDQEQLVATQAIAAPAAQAAPQPVAAAPAPPAAGPVAPPPAPGRAPGATSALDEVVVTATRQSESVNRVPVAVTAQTQHNLDQQGVLTIADLQSLVPGLRITAQEGSGNSKIAIRGIRQTIGAATTGFYLDETPLQKRDASGFLSQNGTPIPPIFDLDRVEVLRGPQGTLFGGGSEGGTIRYIQTQPSLTRYSTYARAQYSGNAFGDPSYEAGVAVGGPVISDKLGFRAGIFGRKTGGFLDLTDFQTGRVYLKNANSGDAGSARIAVAWAPTTRSLVTASFFTSTDESQHNSNSFTQPVTGQLSVPTVCFNVAANSALPVGAFPRYNPSPFLAGAACQARAGSPGIYVRPGYTLGPLNLSPYQSVLLGPSPTYTQLQVGNLDLKLDLPYDLTFRSITSYTHDRQTGSQPQSFQIGSISYAAVGGIPFTNNGTTFNIPSGLQFDPNVTASVNNLKGNYLLANANNQRSGITQEFRLSSAPNQTPISFVVGLYFSNVRADIHQRATWNNLGFVQMTGENSQQQYGVPDPGYFSSINEIDKDVETAVFGEATWRATSHLSVIGGLRYTHVDSSFSQNKYGPTAFTLTPSLADGTQVIGKISDSPLTPKVSVEYAFTPRLLVYGTAAKGFRAGGINQVITSTGQILLNNVYGASISSLPKFYGSDSVWSYEVGGKFGFLDGRAQINVAAFTIDWTNVQSNQSVGGEAFVVNAPRAESKGVEFEGQFRPIEALTLNTAVSYDRAVYTSSYTIPEPKAPILVVQNGQLFPQPQWTVDFGARYDVSLGALGQAYARADYRWASGYQTSPPGSVSYTPDSSVVPESRDLDLRLGFERANYEINIFALNATDYRNGPQTGGRSQCLNTACTSYAQYTVFRTVNWGPPRQIGVQIVFRH